jgi:hypothetical protein
MWRVSANQRPRKAHDVYDSCPAHVLTNFATPFTRRRRVLTSAQSVERSSTFQTELRSRFRLRLCN